mgnify:CR=1 FL=1
MNTINRLIVVLLDLCLMAAAVIALLVLFQLVTPERFSLPVTWTEQLSRLATLGTQAKLGATLICLALFVAGLILFYFELWLARPANVHVLVKQDVWGAITVSLHSIRQLANYEAGQVTGVREAQAQVRQRAEGLQIRSRVTIDPAASLVELGGVLQTRIKAAIEKHFGLAVNTVQVEAQLTPLTKRQRTARRLQ